MEDVFKPGGSPIRSIPPATQSGHLAFLEWICRHENLAIAGPSGTGKTHFVEAPPTRPSTRPEGRLVHPGIVDRPDQKGERRRQHRPHRRPITRADLVVIDDIGTLPAGRPPPKRSYRVVEAGLRTPFDRCHQQHPSPPDALMPKKRWPPPPSTDLHHAHVIITEGNSHLTVRRRRRKGVMLPT
ncbi:MAG: ATP-binding protein [Micropruina sp.]|nr:ATP-binding protein [Micropruina sp.]